jgi:hypothetical protein
VIRGVMPAWTSLPVAPPAALLPNMHGRGASGMLCDRRQSIPVASHYHVLQEDGLG